MKRDRKSERGGALVIVAIFMLVLTAFAALGIDTGRLALVANEVQVVADAAALGGAQALANGESGRDGALQIAALNYIDGTRATPEDLEITEGRWDEDTNQFVPVALGEQPTAIKVRVTRTVQNLVAPVMGPEYNTSTVTRSAVAGWQGQGQCPSGQCFPLCIGQCNFAEIDTCFNETECLPGFTMVPDGTDTVAWTGFEYTANGPNIKSYLPAECGGAASPPQVSVGDSITLNNGQVDNVLHELAACEELIGMELTVPVCECVSPFNQTAKVVGFATIKIVGVTDTGNPKGITIETLVETNASQGGGGLLKTGTGRIPLLQ